MTAHFLVYWWCNGNEHASAVKRGLLATGPGAQEGGLGAGASSASKPDRERHERFAGLDPRTSGAGGEIIMIKLCDQIILEAMVNDTDTGPEPCANQLSIY